ncbi:MAG TPA: tRNA (guanosine(37)-N1)-methyltransferase TrmD [Candidatus Acidoferrales bacterium]|nr:tRNA (guanosine(37)-N1)-methyltransferase TrmD [Candidatus Acidoferrales bacterium]
MRIDIVTAFPKLLSSPLNESMLRKAQEREAVEIVVHDLRDYTHDKHRTVDDLPYGGGAGMILKPEPIFDCVEKLFSERTYDDAILLTADGETFGQSVANELSLKNNLLFICGHYKGVDERVRERLVTREISIGDFVLTSGEIAAIVVIDAVVRLLPGALGDSESALSDSFQIGLLDSPQYTRPAEFRGMKVPDVLLSGDHEEVKKWRDEMSLARTAKRRADLLDPGALTREKHSKHR